MAEAAGEQLNIATQKVAPDVSAIRLDGSLDWSNFSQVELKLEELFKQSVYKLIINLENTKYISSAGFGCFISALDTAIKNNGDIIFVAPPPDIQDVFNLLGLSKVLRFADNEEEATGLFAT